MWSGPQWMVIPYEEAQKMLWGALLQPGVQWGHSGHFTCPLSCGSNFCLLFSSLFLCSCADPPSPQPLTPSGVVHSGLHTAWTLLPAFPPSSLSCCPPHGLSQSPALGQLSQHAGRRLLWILSFCQAVLCFESEIYMGSQMGFWCQNPTIDSFTSLGFPAKGTYQKKKEPNGKQSTILVSLPWSPQW